MRLLVVDDEQPVRSLLRNFLQDRGYEVETAASGQQALEFVRRQSFDLVLLDLMLPGLDGLSTLKQIKAVDEQSSVLIMTGYGTIKSAIDTLKSGADEFLIKPLSLEALSLIVDRIRKQRRLKCECEHLRIQLGKQKGERRVVTRNRRMQDILELVSKVAPLRSTVLIQGESGTGKELIARAIHEESPRAEHRFIAINCSVIPVHLLESELFGYERGAFTGATSRKIGYFEAAKGGTVFLDEISEMSVDLQVKLLRVIQERSFQRVGGTEEIPADVRLIASTNRDLEGEVAQGRFRKDLYYRVNVVRIVVPPLRERQEDVVLLAQFFLNKYTREFRKKIIGMDPEVLELFQRHRWEGNVRELENVVERAVAIAEGAQLTLKDLPQELKKVEICAGPGWELKPFQAAKQDFELEYLRQVLEKAGGNIAQAARLSDIPRQNLYEKLQKHGIDRNGITRTVTFPPGAAAANGQPGGRRVPAAAS